MDQSTAKYLLVWIVFLIGGIFYYFALNELTEKNKPLLKNLFVLKVLWFPSDFTRRGWFYFLFSQSLLLIAAIIGILLVLNQSSAP